LKSAHTRRPIENLFLENQNLCSSLYIVIKFLALELSLKVLVGWLKQQTLCFSLSHCGIINTGIVGAQIKPLRHSYSD